MNVAHRDEFEEIGFFVARRAFEPSLALSVGAELERVHADFDELKAKEPLMHRLGEWSIRSPHLGSKVIRDFIYSEHYVRLCQLFLGEGADLYWSATAAKPRERGKRFPWHQDAGYGGPEEYITLWAAFDDVDEENGCLWAIPRSHREGILPHERIKSDDVNYAGVFIQGSYARAQERVPIRLSPGDAVCMHSKLVHASFENRSDRARRGLITAFIKPGAHQIVRIIGTPEATEPFMREGQIR